MSSRVGARRTRQRRPHAKEPTMPVHDDAPVGAPCWIELFTKDPDTTQSFYNQLFGWTCEDAGQGYGGYFNFSKRGRRVAGGMQNDGSHGTPDGWSVYLA